MENEKKFTLSEELSVTFSKFAVSVTKTGIGSLHFSNMDFEEFLFCLGVRMFENAAKEPELMIGEYTLRFMQSRDKYFLKIYTNYGNRYLLRLEENHVKLLQNHIYELFPENCEWFEKSYFLG